MSTEYSHPELIDAAIQTQSNNRDRSQFNSDSILISSKSDDFSSPCGVLLLRSDDMRKELTENLAARCPQIGNDDKMGAKLSLQALFGQTRDRVTEFHVKNRCHSDLLPGGAAIVDHLAAFVTQNSGYSELKEPIERIRNTRMPSLEQAKRTNVLEIVLGISTATDMLHAATWIQERMKDTRDHFNGLAICAADTESVSVMKSVDIPNEQALLATFKNSRVPVRLSQYPAPSGSSMISCPVLFMYGSIGWQLHIRIQVRYHIRGLKGKDQKTEVAFHGGVLPNEEWAALLNQLEPAVGTGISSDYPSFFRVVKALYGNNSMPRGQPVEIERLAKLAGADHPQTGLVCLVYIWLGGVLPKHYMCSLGDGKWGRPFGDLPLGLQLYLIGDIQQVAEVATLMLFVHTLHLFPDPTHVFRTTAMRGAELVTYWGNRVFKLLSQNPVAWDSLPQCDIRFRSRRSLLESAGIPGGSNYDILRLCPDWPAITNGGPRYEHPVAEWYEHHYNILRENDCKIFPPLTKQELRVKTTRGVTTPSVLNPDTSGPSSSGILAVHPLMAESAWISLPHDHLTAANIREYVTTGPALSIRSVMDRYFRHNKVRALTLLRYWEADRRRPEALFGRVRSLLLVVDLREFLRANNMMPERTGNWIDPLGEDQYNALKAVQPCQAQPVSDPNPD